MIADYQGLGFSLVGHPLDRYEAWRRRLGIHLSGDLTRVRRGDVLAAGLVVVRQRPSTAKGGVFFLLEDAGGTTNVIVPERVDARDRGRCATACSC